MVRQEFIEAIWDVNVTEVSLYYKGKDAATFKMAVENVYVSDDYIIVYGNGNDAVTLEGDITYDEENESYVFTNGDLITYIAA